MKLKNLIHKVAPRVENVASKMDNLIGQAAENFTIKATNTFKIETSKVIYENAITALKIAGVAFAVYNMVTMFKTPSGPSKAVKISNGIEPVLHDVSSIVINNYYYGWTPDSHT